MFAKMLYGQCKCPSTFLRGTPQLGIGRHYQTRPRVDNMWAMLSRNPACSQASSTSHCCSVTNLLLTFKRRMAAIGRKLINTYTERGIKGIKQAVHPHGDFHHLPLNDGTTRRAIVMVKISGTPTFATKWVIATIICSVHTGWFV